LPIRVLGRHGVSQSLRVDLVGNIPANLQVLIVGAPGIRTRCRSTLIVDESDRP
jgi:hypothetical protein